MLTVYLPLRRKFAGGGNAMGIVSSVLGGVSSTLDSAMQNAQIADTSAIESTMDNAGKNVEASSLDSLMEQWGATSNFGNQTSWRDVRRMSEGEMAGNILGAGLSGAAAGAQGGIIGTIIGGAAGLLGSGIGAAVGNQKARNKAAELNKMANEANLRQQLAFSSNAQSIMNQQNLANMSTLFSKGGKIYIKPSKRGTFTAAAKKRGMGVQEFASKVLANKGNYSPAMVKKANFARNFGGHRKDEGGYKEQAKDILRKQVEGLKSKNSKNPRRVDFTTYNPLYDRSFIPKNMSALQDSMINRGYPEPQRYTVLSNILHESGGDPNAIDATGKFRGIAQWSKERYPEDLSFEEQITKLLNESEISEQPYWSDGGGGKPYIGKLKDGYDKFWSTPYTDSAALYYTKGYIRPAEEKARFNRAREAVNMEKHAKAHGGFLTHGGEFSNGITQINNGGQHEQNPMEGVPMGIAPDGLPNLVEEGEVIFNDYVFSNRLKPKKETLKASGLKGYKNKTFAQIAKDLQKESEERPNDPISKRGLEDSMGKLMAVQETMRRSNDIMGTNRLMSCGGRKYSGVFDIFPTKDEILPFDLSNRVPPPSRLQQIQYLNKVLGNPLSNPIDFPFTPRKVDVTSPVELIPETIPADELPIKQEIPRITSVLPKITVRAETGTPLEERVQTPSPVKPKNRSTWMRYMPAIGSAIGSLVSAFSKPDYEHSNTILNELNRQRPRGVRFKPISNYMRYNPLNTSYLMNRLGAETAASRRALENTGGGNAGAVRNSLIGLNRSAQDALGDAYLKAEQYNDNLMRQVEEFNRGTNMFNSQGAMQADTYNSGLQNTYDARRLSTIGTIAGMREAADAALEQNRSANFTGLFDTLGDIGRENFIFNQVNSNDAWRYMSLPDGRTGYKKHGGMLTKSTRNRRRR